MTEENKPSAFDEFLQSAHGIAPPSGGGGGSKRPSEQKKTSAFWRTVYGINLLLWPILIGGMIYNATLTHEQKEAMRIEAAQEKAHEVAKAKEADEACAKDLSCTGDKHNTAASKQCSPAIERLAKNDYEWTAWLVRFSHFRWGGKTDDVVTFLGDEIKFQNGFGAWQRHAYECDFNVQTKEVIDVRVRPGRLSS